MKLKKPTSSWWEVAGAVGRAESEICDVGWTLPLCGLMTRETASCLPCKKGKFEGFLPDLKAQGSETESPALGHCGMGGVTYQSCDFQLASDWLAVRVGKGKGRSVGRRERVSHWLPPDVCPHSAPDCPPVCRVSRGRGQPESSGDGHLGALGRDRVPEGPLDAPSFT